MGAIAVLDVVITLLALLHQTEIGKELDHELATEVKSLHAKAHALRKKFNSDVHHLFHKHKEPK